MKKRKVPTYAWNLGKKRQCLFNRHVKNISNGFILVFHFNGLAVVAFPFALLARNIYVRKKMHLYLDNPVSLAVSASSLRKVKTKAGGSVPPYLAVRKVG